VTIDQQLDVMQVPPDFEQFWKREGSTGLQRFLRSAQTLLEQPAARAWPPAISVSDDRYGDPEDPAGAMANDNAPSRAATTRTRREYLTATDMAPPWLPDEGGFPGPTGIDPKIAGRIASRSR